MQLDNSLNIEVQRFCRVFREKAADLPVHRSACLVVALMVSACAISPVPSEEFPVDTWRLDDGRDPSYLIAPGDTVEVTVYSADELSRTVQVGPDGRIRLPLAGPVAVAARSPEEAREALVAAFSGQLKQPELDIIITDFGSQQIFVGGEVNQPGLIALPGQIDPLQAVIMAGGVTDRGRARDVILMRRLPGGQVRTALIDLRAGLSNPDLANWLPLRRFDVVYVPKTQIAAQNLFIQQYVRDALPIQFSLFYDIAGNNN